MSYSAGGWRSGAQMGWGAWQQLTSLNPQTDWRGGFGSVVWRGRLGTSNTVLKGVSRNSSGAILGSCGVELFLTATDQVVQRTVSDASGNFTFPNPGTGPFYIVAYKAGAPDVAGTTVNTLISVSGT